AQDRPPQLPACHPHHQQGDQPPDRAEPGARVPADLAGRPGAPHGGGARNGEPAGQRADRGRAAVRSRRRHVAPGPQAYAAARARARPAGGGHRRAAERNAGDAGRLRRAHPGPGDAADPRHPGRADRGAGHARPPAAGGQLRRGGVPGDRPRRSRNGGQGDGPPGERPHPGLARRGPARRAGGGRGHRSHHRARRSGLRPGADVAGAPRGRRAGQLCLRHLFRRRGGGPGDQRAGGARPPRRRGRVRPHPADHGRARVPVRLARVLGGVHLQPRHRRALPGPRAGDARQLRGRPRIGDDRPGRDRPRPLRRRGGPVRTRTHGAADGAGAGGHRQRGEPGADRGGGRGGGRVGHRGSPRPGRDGRAHADHRHRVHPRLAGGIRPADPPARRRGPGRRPHLRRARHRM
ncbi:MAG: hypothetical protein AVDCRST_MAG89-2533, partial [uncultured Gemmatimonadetes bacterium]